MSHDDAAGGSWWGRHGHRWVSMRVVKRLPQVLLGSGLLGLGIALMADGGLGFGPWMVLGDAISERAGVSLGAANIMLGIAVMAAWLLVKENPGIGTLITAFEVGLMINVGVLLFPEPSVMWARLAMTTGGVVVAGSGIGIYLAADLGPGPRDGLMTGLHRRTGRSIRLIRTVVEGFALVCGFLLGGTIGLGTVLMAFGLGPVIQANLGVWDKEGRVMQRKPVLAP